MCIINPKLNSISPIRPAPKRRSNCVSWASVAWLVAGLPAAASAAASQTLSADSLAQYGNAFYNTHAHIKPGDLTLVKIIKRTDLGRAKKRYTARFTARVLASFPVVAPAGKLVTIVTNNSTPESPPQMRAANTAPTTVPWCPVGAVIVCAIRPRRRQPGFKSTFAELNLAIGYPSGSRIPRARVASAVSAVDAFSALFAKSKTVSMRAAAPRLTDLLRARHYCRFAAGASLLTAIRPPDLARLRKLSADRKLPFRDNLIAAEQLGRVAAGQPTKLAKQQPGPNFILWRNLLRRTHELSASINLGGPREPPVPPSANLGYMRNVPSGELSCTALMHGFYPGFRRHGLVLALAKVIGTIEAPHRAKVVVRLQLLATFPPGGAAAGIVGLHGVPRRAVSMLAPGQQLLLYLRPLSKITPSSRIVNYASGGRAMTPVGYLAPHVLNARSAKAVRRSLAFLNKTFQHRGAVRVLSRRLDACAKPGRSYARWALGKSLFAGEAGSMDIYTLSQEFPERRGIWEQLSGRRLSTRRLAMRLWLASWAAHPCRSRLPQLVRCKVPVLSQAWRYEPALYGGVIKWWKSPGRRALLFCPPLPRAVRIARGKVSVDSITQGVLRPFDAQVRHGYTALVQLQTCQNIKPTPSGYDVAASGHVLACFPPGGPVGKNLRFLSSSKSHIYFPRPWPDGYRPTMNVHQVPRTVALGIWPIKHTGAYAADMHYSDEFNLSGATPAQEKRSLTKLRLLNAMFRRRRVITFPRTQVISWIKSHHVRQLDMALLFLEASHDPAALQALSATIRDPREKLSVACTVATKIGFVASGWPYAAPALPPTTVRYLLWQSLVARVPAMRPNICVMPRMNPDFNKCPIRNQRYFNMLPNQSSRGSMMHGFYPNFGRGRIVLAMAAVVQPKQSGRNLALRIIADFPRTTHLPDRIALHGDGSSPEKSLPFYFKLPMRRLKPGDDVLLYLGRTAANHWAPAGWSMTPLGFAAPHLIRSANVAMLRRGFQYLNTLYPASGVRQMPPMSSKQIAQVKSYCRWAIMVSSRNATIFRLVLWQNLIQYGSISLRRLIFGGWVTTGQPDVRPPPMPAYLTKQPFQVENMVFQWEVAKAKAMHEKLPRW